MIRMTAKIVSAYVRGNAVSASDVASLIQSTYEGLARVQAPEAEAEDMARHPQARCASAEIGSARCHPLSGMR